jgi:hypothetical protein
MPTSVDDWIESYRLAWENRDADAAARLFTPEATYRNNIFEPPHQGQDGVHDYWAGVTEGQSDVAVRMGRPFVDGKRVTVEFWTNMKIDGGDTTLAGCLLLDFDDDWLCRRLREYWFFVPGNFDPPPEWGE